MRAKRLLLAALLAAVVAGGVFVYFRWRQPVALPDVDLTDVDPDVRSLVESARVRVQKEPASSEAWGHLGQVLLGNGFEDAALPALERAGQLDPNQPRWPYLRGRRLWLSDRDRGRELLERAARLAERSDPENVACKLLLVEVLAREGDHQRAMTLCREVLEQEPDNGLAHFFLGTGYLQLDDPKKSLAHLLRAADSPHARRRACTQLATVSLHLGDGAAAERFTRRAGELPPDEPAPDPYAAEFQALAAARQAKFVEAERLEGQGRLRESARLLRELSQTSPDLRSGVALGIALVKLGDNAGAEKVLSEALTKGASSPTGYYALALAQYSQAESLREQDKTKAAAEKYRQVEQSALATLADKPDHGPAHLFVGQARRRLGRFDEAIDSLRKAIACRPELVGHHLALGEALAEAGQLDEARKALRQAITLAHPADPEGRQARAALAELDRR
jgi:tetratricopeptide (TPR) repeat protein